MSSWAKIVIISNLIKLLYILREIENKGLESFSVNLKREELEIFERELRVKKGDPIEITCMCYC